MCYLRVSYPFILLSLPLPLDVVVVLLWVVGGVEGSDVVVGLVRSEVLGTVLLSLPVGLGDLGDDSSHRSAAAKGFDAPGFALSSNHKL